MTAMAEDPSTSHEECRRKQYFTRLRRRSQSRCASGMKHAKSRDFTSEAHSNEFHDSRISKFDSRLLPPATTQHRRDGPQEEHQGCRQHQCKARFDDQGMLARTTTSSASLTTTSLAKSLSATSPPSRLCAPARPSSSSSPATRLLCVSRNSSVSSSNNQTNL